MSEQQRPSSANKPAYRGTQKAIVKALGGQLMIDAAADAAFARSLEQLRNVPGTNGVAADALFARSIDQLRNVPGTNGGKQ